MTIAEIINELKDRVEKDIPISPSSWVEAAIRINVQSDTMDNKLAEYEGVMAEAEALAVGQGEPASKAKILARQEIDYVDYLKLKANLKRIDEFVKLAKRRSQIEFI